jgi:histidinol-phosphatase (PHP family)
VTFTEHFDTHPEDWKSCTYDEEAYSATIERLRTQFGDSIYIGKGIEICYQPERMDFVLDFLKRCEFDIVVLSVHYFGNKAVHQRANWEGVEPVDGTRRYLETVRDAACYCERLHRTAGRVFDVLGHMDLVKRYTQRWFGVREVSRFGSLIDEILQTCIAADVVPEVNTSTLRQNLGEPMPGPDVIARYVQMGGNVMSLGSDAHRAEHVGADFTTATAILREAGIHHTALFKKRRRYDIPIK